MQPKRASEPSSNLQVTQILRRYADGDPRERSVAQAQLRAIQALVRGDGEVRR